ncbi:hypothetical protein FOQG_09649 [Fusarium oxysporum f. sp. raphani 54005]|uniref:Uncharacterized protein n=1 Tax=Fusarium oxysporum f. sp. raphani 54005 TaxID=1089458 RepID=X0CV60_FUSOX|nr:hypothetical protein FOQG_09649 [Fusarium oxysporum f. sp. raphani 54005]
MTALGNIQKTLDSLQDKQQQQTNIAIIGGSLTSIKTWQTRYATATKFNNTSEINTLINEFNENAPTYITKIFNVLNGQGLGPGTAPLLKSWHAASYAKMYTPVNGQYAFTLRNYLDDYNSIVSWVISMAALAAPTMSASYFQGEADQYTSDFQTNATAVLGVAYDQFAPFVKKFKPNYTDVGPNLNQWFRMWYNETHVKNYIGWRGSSRNVEDDQNYGVPQFNAGNNEYQLYPLACDDDEVHIYNCEDTGASSNLGDMSGVNSAGLTTTADSQYWCSGVTFNQAIFNVLPLSSEDMGGNTAPGFLLLVANPPTDKQHGIFDPQFPSTVSSKQKYCILRDDGLDQTSWVQTQNSASTAPGDNSEVPSPNPSV